MFATVELYDKPASVLTILFDCRRNDNWLEETKHEVTPVHISEAVSLAIFEGWNLEQYGENHQIEIKIT